MSYAIIIDDDPSQVERLQKAADAKGMHVETAATWDEGYALFNALSPDLVIADYNLPGSRHGLQLLLEVAKLRPSVRLILISAYLNEEDVRKIEDLDLVDAVLRKLDPVETARAVLREVEQARDKRDVATDWPAFAMAAGRARRVSEEDLNTLDQFLQSNRLPRQTL